ncbi:MAG: hypothetical protein H6Q43_3875 [Deltaproteobacteria bacterium]|nr:hypothetical protein [Deltaproteobacteria bacterium]
MRFAKVPAGITAFICETKGSPQREAEGLQPRPLPWKDHHLVIARSAAMSPCLGEAFEVFDPLVFLKREGGKVDDLH